MFMVSVFITNGQQDTAHKLLSSQPFLSQRCVSTYTHLCQAVFDDYALVARQI